MNKYVKEFLQAGGWVFLVAGIIGSFIVGNTASGPFILKAILGVLILIFANLGATPNKKE